MIATTSYIDLLRHGEVEGGPCYRGITDDPLSTTGWEQMHNKLTDKSHWDVIISSPLSRCHAFAQVLSSDMHVPLIISPAFQEINFGDWEGKTAEQINRTDEQILKQFYASPVDFPPPNGEHFTQFQHRVIQAWRDLYVSQQGKRILLITHAGVIRVILADLLGCDIEHSFRLKIAHACISNIVCFHDTKTEDFFQLTGHG